MYLDFKKTKGKPLYIQLYDAIASEICNNRILNGAKLPTRRALADQLDIAQTTVDSAYKMLQDTGYILSIPRRGYIVSFKSSLYTENIPWETTPKEEYVFSPNGIDTTHLARSSYAKILKDIAYNDGIDIFSYVEKGGELALRNAISKYLYSFRDVKCSPDRIIIGAGSEYLTTALAVVFPVNTTYICENPCDTHFYRSLDSYRNKVVSLPPNVDEFDIEALHSLDGDILFVEPDARFPRSQSIPEDIRKEILNWAYESPSRYIVEIGTDSEIQWNSNRTLYSMDTQNKVIYLGSFARSLCPAMKTSYMVLPEELLIQWKIKHVYYYSLTSKQEQYAISQFINKGYFTKHYKQMRRIYNEKCEYLKECLKNNFGDEVQICGDSASTYITVDFPSENNVKIAQNAKKNGVKIHTTQIFSVSPETDIIPNDKLIIGIGDLNREKISTGIHLLKSSIQNSN